MSASDIVIECKNLCSISVYFYVQNNIVYNMK